MTQLSAQVLTGKVVGADKEPLPFANVVLLKDSTFVNGVITDDRGEFLFDQHSASANRIKISMTGYEDYFALIAPTGDFGTIMLKESSVMLDEVVVRANLPTTRLKGNAMVTNVENSVLSRLGTASDVLSHLPLVSESDGSFTVIHI
ncbi:MAG: carboxypeptidase-like regulatory domain-containing protein [Duncaniella sp.]|nr:carboxypeptidase-like regulatory domain-containing protein [Duncaniella sp.]